ncbi:UDP-N-acetylmuramoyl-tripeptide--D-alanyl-D-alanine ligase [Chloroflexi bacterium TSY]|nr:UDP-N-acetylmuramoyl-tripeptide--D-alanyl-D-alanine ligase [Chloroflexi bacterium TSY]
MAPIVKTQITHHTLWQAIVGQTPPLALPAEPIPRAVLDSRDVTMGDLFVALPGSRQDGHDYISSALENGSSVVICEERGRKQAEAHNAVTIDVLAERTQWPHGRPSLSTLKYDPSRPLAFIVPDSQAALQQVGAFQRLHRCQAGLRVIGITGSVGKSSSKELAASVLRQRFNTYRSQGNLNSEQGLPLALLGLDSTYERAVLEMGMYALGEIHDLCIWARPHIGVVTNVEPVHLERLKTLERILQAKTELVEALPSADQGGVAILNWDDENVRTMAEKTSARLFWYGLTKESNLWADEIESVGAEGIRFRFHHRKEAGRDSGKRNQGDVESVHVRVPLLGRHSVHTALRSAAVGLVEGLSWAEIIEGMQDHTNQLRLVMVTGINSSTVIDDTYNASPPSTIAALNLLDDLEPTGQGRRVAVLGDMLELGKFTEEGHKLVGRRAADVVDLLITVGELGREIGEEAHAAGLVPGQLHLIPDHEQAISLLQHEIRPNDLILVKGSRAIGMDLIVPYITLKS